MVLERGVGVWGINVPPNPRLDGNSLEHPSVTGLDVIAELTVHMSAQPSWEMVSVGAPSVLIGCSSSGRTGFAHPTLSLTSFETSVRQT